MQRLLTLNSSISARLLLLAFLPSLLSLDSIVDCPTSSPCSPLCSHFLCTILFCHQYSSPGLMFKSSFLDTLSKWLSIIEKKKKKHMTMHFGATLALIVKISLFASYLIVKSEAMTYKYLQHSTSLPINISIIISSLPLLGFKDKLSFPYWKPVSLPMS